MQEEQVKLICLVIACSIHGPFSIYVNRAISKRKATTQLTKSKHNKLFLLFFPLFREKLQ